MSEEIKRCWRRETGSQLHIRLPRDNLYWVDLPAIKGGFDHVQELVLSNVKWGGHSSALFLENFTELNSLSITGAEMTELPAVIGDMKQLTTLKLHANGLQLTERSAGLLSDLNALQVLDLSSNPLGVTPDFSGMPHLRELNLYWTRIERWPSGLREQAGLERLDLRQNRLQQVPRDNLVPPADQLETVARINNVTLLENNRFPPITGKRSISTGRTWPSPDPTCCKAHWRALSTVKIRASRRCSTCTPSTPCRRPGRLSGPGVKGPRRS